MLQEKQHNLCPDFTKITHVLRGHKHLSYAEFHRDRVEKMDKADINFQA